MALFSSYLTAYGDGTGKTKEFKLDKITLAVQAQTPMLDSASRAKVTNQHFIWEEESLSTGNPNAHAEGVQFTDLGTTHTSAPTISPREGYAQLFAKGVEVTDQQEKSNKASVTGTNSEMKDQLYAKSIEIKTDIEAALMGEGTASAGAGTGSTGAVSGNRALAGYFSQISTATTKSNQDSGGSGDRAWDITGVPGTDADVGDTIYRFDQTNIALFDEGGLNWDGGNGLVKDANMSTMSPLHKHYWDLGLDSRSNNRRDVGATGMSYGVRYTTYVSSYGDFKVMPNKFQLNTTIAIYNPQNWAVAVYSDVATKDVASLGLSERKIMSASLGFIHRNQRVSGAVTDIDATAAPITAA